LTFSGHETFHCRQFWLKKGYEFYRQNKADSGLDALIQMGVGRNMVTSIQYWLRSFGLLDDKNQITQLACYLLDDDGQDPYLENVGSLWLLHYQLIKHEHASIYSLMFNELRKERIEFTRGQIVNFLEKKCQEQNRKISINSLNQDARVFINNYLRPKRRNGNIEDVFSALMIDLELLQEMGRTDAGKEIYKIEGRERPEIPIAIILYCILEENQGSSIAFNTMLVNRHSVGSIFALNREGLMQKLNKISEAYPGITFTDDAGIRELQFIQRPNPQTILDNYYAI